MDGLEPPEVIVDYMLEFIGNLVFPTGSKTERVGQAFFIEQSLRAEISGNS